jgi:hypothetical protein
MRPSRKYLIVGAGALILSLVGQHVWSHQIWWMLIVFGVLALVQGFFGLDRYGRKQVPHGQDWTRTEERFIESDTGQAIEVLVNTATGERRYVPASGTDRGDRTP